MGTDASLSKDLRKKSQRQAFASAKLNSKSSTTTQDPHNLWCEPHLVVWTGTLYTRDSFLNFGEDNDISAQPGQGERKPSLRLDRRIP